VSEQWTTARYRAAVAAGETWPTRRCEATERGHRAHRWVEEPGDGFRYHYWCEGEEQ